MQIGEPASGPILGSRKRTSAGFGSVLPVLLEARFRSSGFDSSDAIGGSLPDMSFPNYFNEVKLSQAGDGRADRSS